MKQPKSFREAKRQLARLSPLSRRVIFTRACVSLTLLYLRKMGTTRNLARLECSDNVGDVKTVSGDALHVLGMFTTASGRC